MSKLLNTEISIKKLMVNIEKAITEYAEELGEGYPVFVEILVDNHHGQYIPQIAYEIFGYEAEAKEPSDEWYWEEFEEFEEKLYDQLHELLKEHGIEFKGHNLYFGFGEGAGDWGLLIERNELL